MDGAGLCVFSADVKDRVERDSNEEFFRVPKVQAPSET